MVTLSSDTRTIIGRGPPLGARLFFLGLLAVGVMVLDHQGQYLETARRWMGIAMTPLYVVVEAPGSFWGWMTGSFSDRAQLRSQNARLTEELREARVKLLQYEALTEENQRLRALRAASQGIAERTLIAEIINVDDVDPFRHRIRINKGAVDGVYKRQPVLDAFGIVGQVVRVDRYNAQVILISDAAHAIQVQINRNGIRSIASGIGDLGKLSLPYMTIESDVKVDDLLVSSGLDGIFPPGYPVARVSKVERDPSATFAVVEAKPLAQLDRNREVLLLWANRAPATVPQSAKPEVPPAGNIKAPPAPTQSRLRVLTDPKTVSVAVPEAPADSEPRSPTVAPPKAPPAAESGTRPAAEPRTTPAVELSTPPAAESEDEQEPAAAPEVQR